jgi:CDGSH iron-sulfur domain-containing protein 3
MPDVKVIVRPDGPLQILGPILVENLDGSPIDVVGDPKGIFLCRCGRSTQKPFCDGSHKRSGWKQSTSQETA